MRDDVGEEVYSSFKHWDLGDIVAAEGFMFITKTGELSIHATSIRLLQHRNVQQDVALAKKLGRDAGIQAFVRGGLPPELAVPAGWCAAPSEEWRTPLGTEWYLRVRDHLYRP